MSDEPLNYQLLTEDALRGVVRKSLNVAAQRGLPGHRTKPSAEAPSDVARPASASRVTPQILNGVTPHLRRACRGPGAW